MQTLWQDVRYGLRILFRSPGFTTVAVLTLALGIGANTAMFSIIDAVLLNPLPYKGSERLVAIQTENQQQGITAAPVSYTKVLRVQEQSHTIESVGAYLPINVTLTGSGTPEQINSAIATANLFDVLGTALAQGRGFLPQEDQPGGANVAIVTDAFWRSHLEGAPDVVGKSISLDGRSVTIVGVLPRNFRFPFRQPAPDLWQPRAFENPGLDPLRVRTGASYLIAYARLRAGATIESAQSDLNTINTVYAHDFPGYVDSNFTLTVSPLKETLVGPLKISLLVLLAAVGFVLLIGCANIASLLLARATARRKEIAVRQALGAAPLRLARQLLTESLVLSAVGGFVGVLMAAGTGSLLRRLPVGTLPRAEDVHPDATVLCFSLVVCVVTGIAFGFVPALQMSQRNFSDTLNEGGRGSSTGRKGGRSRAALVVAQVAVALVLVTGAGVLVKSFANLMRVDPGLDPNNVMTFSLTLPVTRYPEPARQAEFYRRLVESVKSLPGVQSAGVVNFLPLIGATRFVFFCPEGTVCQGIGKDPIIALRQVTPDYLKTMRIPLLRGRQFDDHDNDGAKPVVIINQWTANHFFPNQDPIGKHLMQSREKITREIVGVVGNVPFNGLNAPNFQEMYLPHAQSPFAAMTLAVRSQSDPQSLLEAVRRLTLEIDADVPFSDVASMASVISASTAQPRLTTQLTGFFAALALLLTAVGIYGVLAYSVAQRRHEMGIRMALGARAADILTLVVGQGMRLVLVGLAVGFVASLALTRLIASLLFATSVRDPFTLSTAILLLAGVAALACYIPARRASRVDPVIVLRYE